MDSATSVATTPTASEILPPNSTRANKSRPNVSVPNQCAWLGALAYSARSCASGSGAITPAKMHSSATTITITPPTTDNRFFNNRCHASFHRLLPASASSSASGSVAAICLTSSSSSMAENRNQLRARDLIKPQPRVQNTCNTSTSRLKKMISTAKKITVPITIV